MHFFFNTLHLLVCDEICGLPVRSSFQLFCAGCYNKHFGTSRQISCPNRTNISKVNLYHAFPCILLLYTKIFFSLFFFFFFGGGVFGASIVFFGQVISKYFAICLPKRAIAGEKRITSVAPRQTILYPTIWPNKPHRQHIV